MKKAVSILLMFVAFLIIYFLQVNFFTWFNIAGVMPNLFILLIMVIGLFAGKYAGISTGVVAGLFLDIFISKKNRCNCYNPRTCRIYRSFVRQELL